MWSDVKRGEEIGTHRRASRASRQGPPARRRFPIHERRIRTFERRSRWVIDVAANVLAARPAVSGQQRLV